MKIILTLIGTLLFSMYSIAFAETHFNDISAEIQHNIHNNLTNTQSALIYGGQDVSRSHVAIANERTSPIQPRVLG